MAEAQQQHSRQSRIPSLSQWAEEEDEEECDSVSWTEQTEGSFQQKLINIDEEMGTDDLQGLKFLCRGRIKASKLESATSPIDIFVHMKEVLPFDEDNQFFLLECLARLDRLDLIRKLGFDPNLVKAELPHREMVEKFRQLLLKMAEKMADKDLQKLKFFLNVQINKKLSDTKSILDIFIIMEQKEIVTPQKLDGLAKIMSSIGRQDLMEMVKSHIGYVPNRPQPQFSQIGNQSNGVGLTGLGINSQTGDRTVSEIAGPSGACSTPPVTPSREDDFKSRFDDEFEVKEIIGSGGFGVVFKAYQKFDEQEYAVKRIAVRSASEGSKEKVKREVKALAKLDHPNIVRYYNSWVETPPPGWQEEKDKKHLSMSEAPSTVDSKVDDENITECSDANDRSNLKDAQHIKDSDNIVFHYTNVGSNCNNDVTKMKLKLYQYIQMQLCKKETLKDWLQDTPDRCFDGIKKKFIEIVSAVDYIHKKGMIHRDLKPSNIFFSLEGNIKVGDFGLAQTLTLEMDGELSGPGNRQLTTDVGTKSYMSPEQLEGKDYAEKIDIYALGLILFEMCNYSRTESGSIQLLAQIRNSEFPDGFFEKEKAAHTLVSKMLQLRPEDRPTASRIREVLSLENDYIIDFDSITIR